MPISISGTNGVTLSGQFDSASSFGFKNRIINGAMVIDQRNAGASITNPAGSYSFPVDRFSIIGSVASKFTAQQNAGSVTPPDGFSTYLGFTSSSAYSIVAGDYFFFRQNIEGFNFSDMQWGTANAKTVTLSFWVRSSLTGTFGGAIQNSAQTRSYPFTYTINVANTWEQKSITIAGDTSGTWIGATNGIGFQLNLSLGTGSTYSGTAGAWATSGFIASATGATSVVGTNGATFYITGVQLEKGSTATSFDYRPYGTELQLCQRYYYRITNDSGVAGNGPFGSGFVFNASNFRFTIPFPVKMRIAPTALEQTGTATDYRFVAGSTGTTCSSVPTFGNGNSFCADVLFGASGLTTGNGGLALSNSTSAYLGWSAEL